MISPIFLSNVKNSHIPFKNESQDINAVNASQNSISSDSDTFARTSKVSDNSSLTQQLGVLGLFFIGVAVLISGLKNGKPKPAPPKNNDYVMKTFESLKERVDIPTLDTCKSLDKSLKDFLQKRVDYINAPQELKEKAGKLTDENRLLLYGDPGNGKTFFGKVLAKTLDADFMEIKFSDYNSSIIGEDIERMKTIFDAIIADATANPKKKYVVVYNEIDAAIQPITKLADIRKNRHILYKIEERATLLQYLDEIFERTPNVTIIGTTNQSPKNNGLDGAIMSRFKNIYKVDYPNSTALYEALIKGLESIKKDPLFVSKNQSGLKSLASDMEKRKSSFRDLNKVIERSKDLFIEDGLKDKNAEYKFEYLKKSLDSLKDTDGELAGVVKNRKGEENESESYFRKLWNKIFKQNTNA